MTTPIIIAVLSFAVPFVLALAYPLALMLYLPKSTHPQRWIQNNPSFSIFLLSSFPVAVCVLSLSMSQDGVLDYWFGGGWQRWVSYAVLAVTILIVTLIVLDDFTRRPMAPYVLRKNAAAQAARLEKELRDASDQQNKSVEAKRREYQKQVKLGTLKAVLARGGPIAYIHMALAWMGDSRGADLLLVSGGSFAIPGHTGPGAGRREQKQAGAGLPAAADLVSFAATH